MSNARTLVVENDPTDDVRLLGEWLTGAGLELEVVRPHAGEPLPTGSGPGTARLDGYGALVVMGGGIDGAPWYPEVEDMFRVAVRDKVPTLGVCLGAQLMARAFGGYVERAKAGPEIGPRLVAKRDAAGNDPLFGPLPMLPDVIQWHRDEVTELPEGAVLLAASPRYPHQAFRYGDRAWAVQFHLECDRDMLAGWAADADDLGDLGLDEDELLAGVDEVLPLITEVWRPFAQRFADLALGRLAFRSELPLLGS
ncbi:MAG: type 1 glutamine amidotransferase [Actinocatenispora sp.]